MYINGKTKKMKATCLRNGHVDFLFSKSECNPIRIVKIKKYLKEIYELWID